MRILLAHTKKPPCETRIFNKLAMALIHEQKWEISILGNDIPESKHFSSDQIETLPIFKSKVNKSALWGDLLRFSQMLTLKKPDLIITCSPELLPFAIYFKLIYNCKVVFDVQENHALNFRAQSQNKWPWSYLLSVFARIFFIITYQFVNEFWLAEKIYDSQLKLKKDRIKIFENKVPVFWAKNTLPVVDSDQIKNPYFLFSGFISKESGVLKAVHFFELFHKINPKWQLVIAGYCPDPIVKSFLQKSSARNESIHLYGIDQWLSSQEIHQLLKKSSAVLMPYIETKANFGKTPTKFFEALFWEKPVLINSRSHFSLPFFDPSIHIEVNFERPPIDFIMQLAFDFEASALLQLRKEQPNTFDELGVRNAVTNLLKDF